MLQRFWSLQYVLVRFVLCVAAVLHKDYSGKVLDACMFKTLTLQVSTGNLLHPYCVSVQVLTCILPDYVRYIPV